MRLLPAVALLLAALPAEAQSRPRARDLGIDLGGTPGAHNAITDVAGVEVGHATIIRGVLLPSVMKLLGIEHDLEVQTPIGRPMRLSEGAPIAELFA